MRKSGSVILLCSFLSLLMGCADGGGFSDLDSKMAEARNRPQGTIEPLPTYPPIERFSYSAILLRSPFEPPVLQIGEEKVTGSAVPEPDQTRQKEPLEQVSYSALSMVGTLAKNGRTWALINDGNGRIHRVTEGNYVGKNYGKIVGIDGIEINILETVPDGKGGWINRPRTLAINEE